MMIATMMIMPSASTSATLTLASPTSLDSEVLICWGTVYAIWFSQAWMVAKADRALANSSSADPKNAGASSGPAMYRQYGQV